MSWTDEEIDKLFQKEAAKQPVEYKDAYWKEFEAMLPVTRKGDFLWFLTSGIFVALLLVTPFVGVLNSERSAEIMAMESGLEMVPSRIEQSRIDNVVESNQNKINTKVSEAVNEEVENKGNTGNEGAAFNPQIKPVKAEQSRIVEHSDANIKTTGFNTRKSAASDQPGVIEFAHVANVVDSEIERDNNNDPNKKDDVFSESLIAETENQQANEISRVIEKEKVVKQGDVNRLDIQSVKTVDQNDVSTSLKSISYDLSMPTRTTFYVEANGGLSQSLITPSDDFSYSFGAGLGTQFRKGRVVFTTGVNAIWAHHKDIHLNRQAKVYGFGSTVVQSHLNYSELYTIEANLNIGYQFGRHNINVGVRPSFVAGSKVKFTQSNSLTNDNRTVYGFMDGINRWGLKPSLGYGFDLNNNLTLGLNVSTQLLKSVNEDFINGVNNTLPIDGQIYLRKTIRLRR
ncbi:MAG: hypothetical protein ACPGVI_02745 [Crocinitomicaceae bacterium]